MVGCWQLGRWLSSGQELIGQSQDRVSHTPQYPMGSNITQGKADLTSHFQRSSAQGLSWGAGVSPGFLELSTWQGRALFSTLAMQVFSSVPSMCLKSQMVDLKAEGYWEELMDTFRPDIVVKDW